MVASLNRLMKTLRNFKIAVKELEIWVLLVHFCHLALLCSCHQVGGGGEANDKLSGIHIIWVGQCLLQRSISIVAACSCGWDIHSAF